MAAYTREVGAAWATLSPSDQASTTIIAGNYGETGALDKFGHGYGLPTVYSGQNQLFEYGPPPATATIVLFVGYDLGEVADAFDSCEQVGTLDDNVGVDNEEQGRSILVCRGLHGTWSQQWPSFQHYD